MAPESLNGSSVLAVCEQEPETEDRLGKNVQDSIGNDLRIDSENTSFISKSPNDWVKSPDNDGEATNRSEELCGSITLAHGCTTTRDDELVEDEKICNYCHCKVSPFLALASAEGSEETKQNHDDICDDGNKDGRSIHASQKCEIEEKERSGESPINVSSPKDLAEDMLDRGGDVIVCLPDNDVCERGATTSGHGEVGDRCKGGNQCGDDMEDTLLDGDSPRHGNEGDGGQQHNHEDNPESQMARMCDFLISWEIWDDRGNGGD